MPLPFQGDVENMYSVFLLQFLDVSEDLDPQFINNYIYCDENLLVVTSCGLVGMYRRFEGNCCVHF